MLYDLDDIKSYLDTFSNVINGIAILDRSFLDMELLKPINSTVSLVGIHFTRPFLSLLLDTDTTYDTLLETFPVLYNDKTTIDVEQLLQAKQKVCNFVYKKRFLDSLPKACLLENLEGCTHTKSK